MDYKDLIKNICDIQNNLNIYIYNKYKYIFNGIYVIKIKQVKLV